MGKKLILTIEDEEDISELMSLNLSKEGYRVECAACGEAGLERAESIMPDLIVLDLELPGMDGFEVCRRLKTNPVTRRIPIIMMMDKNEDSDVIAGLELGGDDYVTKPLSPKVLVARIRTVIRRMKREPTRPAEVIHIHDLCIHPGKQQVHLRGEQLDFSPTEFKVLHALAERPGWLLTRSQIVDRLRSEDCSVTSRSIDAEIASIRTKLREENSYIETVRTVGYRFKE